MFFVTAMRSNPAYTGDPDVCERNVFDSRCFGYYDTREKAVDAVINNVSDIQECYYDYVVIEELEQGIHPLPNDLINYTHETWFVWNKNEEKWVRCEKPTFSDRTCCWAVG